MGEEKGKEEGDRGDIEADRLREIERRETEILREREE